MGGEERRGKGRGRERKGAGAERGKGRERVIPLLVLLFPHFEPSAVATLE